MKNGYDNVGSCPEALEFRSNSYKYGDYLGRFRAEVAKPGMAAVSKTAGLVLGSSNLSLGAIPF